jgi:hypothetical protein
MEAMRLYRLLKKPFQARFWEGHDFQSCRKCQRSNAASGRWGSFWACEGVFQPPV